MSFPNPNRCNACDNCKRLAKIARQLAPNPPFSHTTATDVAVWNDAVEMLPCSFAPTHAFDGVPVREITQDEYCARTHEPRLGFTENILFFEYVDGAVGCCIAWFKPTGESNKFLQVLNKQDTSNV